MKRWMWVVAGAVVLVAVSVGAVVYTERPQFCTSCHEMRPYYNAWRQAAHEDVSCLACHVDPGLGDRLAHKFVALKEVWIHFTSDPLFPRYPTYVPDSRCARCHGTIDADSDLPGFSHDQHQRSGACQGCHPSAGHEVTFDALRQASSLDESIAEEATRPVTGLLHAADPVPADLAEHAGVSCDACHDMGAADCDYCHESPDDHFEDLECALCHRLGVEFGEPTFEHEGRLDCQDCHEPPAEHFAGVRCDGCHETDRAFEEASFDHPGISGGEHSSRSFPCSDCHPNGFGSASCVKCHEGGTPDGDDD